MFRSGGLALMRRAVLQQRQQRPIITSLANRTFSSTSTSAPIITASNIVENSAPTPTAAAVDVITDVVMKTDPPASSLNLMYPSDTVIWIIQNIHEYTGLPWWAAIMLNTFIIRGALLPLIRQQQWAAFRMVQAQPDLQAVSELIKNDPRMTPDEKAARMRAVFTKHQVTPFSMFKVALVQFPIFISCFIGLKQMAETHPTLATGGLFWFTDLTAPDTTYILPAAMTVLNIGILRLGDGQPQHEQMKIVKNVFSGAMLLFFPFVMSFPTLFFMHWGTMSTLSLAQSLVMRNNAARSVLGLPPKSTHIPKPLWGGDDSPFPFPQPQQVPVPLAQAVAPSSSSMRPKSRSRRSRQS